MRIINANVYTADHVFAPGEIVIEDGRIVSAESGSSHDHAYDEDVIDAHGLYAIPGLVDVHFHGAMRYDLCDASPEGLQTIANYEASVGVLAICPATMTYSEEILGKAMEVAAAHKNGEGADLVGVNMEGPFISPNKIGAQNPEYVQEADAAMFRRLQARSGGLIRLVDVAPEYGNNLEFIRECSGEVNISIAHTCTDYETAKEAFRLGANHMTHMYNAMPEMTHRNPGPIPAGMEAGAYAEIIADGIHNCAPMVRIAFKLYGQEKMVLISDSIRACGMKDGEYELGGQGVRVSGKLAVLSGGNGAIAGSVTNLYDCMKNAVQAMDIPLETAVRAASENPAKSIGIDKDYGSLKPGCYGNVLLVDEDLNLVRVIQKGIVRR